MLVETLVIFVDTVDKLVDTPDKLEAAAIAVGTSTTVTAVKLAMLVVRAEILVVRVAALVARLAEFVTIAEPAVVSPVPESVKDVPTLCILPGSINLMPRLTNSNENFFDGTEAANIAGLKNGAVEGSSTATPVLPIAIDRGSKVLNGNAIAVTLLIINRLSADRRNKFLRMAFLLKAIWIMLNRYAV
jgi:hypothetical protein